MIIIRLCIIYIIFHLLIGCSHEEDSGLDRNDLTGLYEVSVATYTEACDIVGSEISFSRYFEIYHPDDRDGIRLQECQGDDLLMLICGGIVSSIGSLLLEVETQGGWEDNILYGISSTDSCTFYSIFTTLDIIGQDQVRYTRTDSTVEYVGFTGECSPANAELYYNRGTLQCDSYTEADAKFIQRDNF